MEDKVFLNGAAVHLDFIVGCDVEIGVISYFDRSVTAVRAFGAGLSVTMSDLSVEDTRFRCGNGREFDVYVQPVTYGKEKFYHALAINKEIGQKMLLVSDKEQEVYDFLMKNFELPLMNNWKNELYSYLSSNQELVDRTLLYRGQLSQTVTIPIRGKDVPIVQLRMIQSFVSSESLANAVQELFQQKRICITNEPQRQLSFDSMDSYFKEYGHTLVENLEKDIVPLRKLDGEAHDFTLKSKRMYPQQLAQLNGDVALLEHGKFAILNHGMGTGKTLSAGGICESFFVRKWLRSHPKAELKDAYTTSDAVRYRNIIMCPGHLVEKWAEEIRSEVPYATVTILRDFSQLLEIRKRGIERTRREYYVLSKDFCKLSYQSIPTPTKRRYGFIKKKQCASCGNEYNIAGHTCPYCGSREYELKPSLNKAEGMVCPHCNSILVPYKFLTVKDNGEFPVLDHMDFLGQNNKNSNCYYCEELLWKPYVANIGGKKEPLWQRATHYANKTHKGTKTVWVHKNYMHEYFQEIGEAPLSIMDGKTHQGVRKYAPAEFIKRYLRGFFDIAIFDEVQDLKGGFTGQGHAMHALIKASKKQLALTGTIAGGYANHLFYTLFRLDPGRMKRKGYNYNDEQKFSDVYGKVEREFEYSDEGNYRVSCKGKQIGQPKTKPGISPLIFMDFLLDRTTFLDLSDMSKYLPKLKEYVVSVPATSDVETEMMHSYKRVIDGLREASRKKESGGFALLSQMLQFSLSYPDKPYGVPDILSPTNGSCVVSPDSYSVLSQVDEFESLSSKEKKVIEIVRSEQAENRNVFIYAEYTGSPTTCVTYRLKEIIERHCKLKGKVAILESTSPSASEREAWMRKMASKGIRVFITNPRCVATGLDFCFKENGIAYNYPTLIFYQMGYSLFTIWQASRRHYRLNQTKECRTYYMAWSATAQEAVISMIAEKQAATSAIQGKFSTEGLAAMANGTDDRLKLAQALSNLDSITGNGLQEMFDVLSADDSDGNYGNYKQMILLKELLGDVKVDGSFDSFQTGQYDLFDMIELLAVNEKKPDTEKPVQTKIIKAEYEETPEAPVVVRMVSGGGKRVVTGQFSLF